MLTQTQADAVRGRVDAALGRGKRTGSEVHYSCPFCSVRKGSESSKRKLGVSYRKGVAHCFRCDWSGTIRSLLWEVKGGLDADDRAALADVRSAPGNRGIVRSQLYGTLLGRDEDVSRLNLKAVALPREYRSLTDASLRRKKLYHLAYAYLSNRGVTGTQIRRYKIGYCTTGRYRRRLVFPITYKGKQVYFTTRYVGDHNIKTLNPKAEEDADGNAVTYHKGACLWGYDRCRGKRTVTIVEGVFDGMACDPAVALLGKTISDAQLGLLHELHESGTSRFVVALDPDAAVQAERLADVVRQRLPDAEVDIVSLDEGDPADHRDEMPAIIEDAGEEAPLRHRLLGRLQLSTVS